MSTNTIAKLAPIATASVAAAAIGFSAAAHACGGNDPNIPASHTFQTPSGNSACDYQLGFDGEPTTAVVSCEVRDHTWAAPRDTDCTGPVADEQRARGLTPDGDTISMYGGKPAKMMCYWGASSLNYPQKSTLEYGQTLSVGTITCDSELSGVMCTDSSSGHFFRVSRDSYELG